jgi:hypothetical protein
MDIRQAEPTAEYNAAWQATQDALRAALAAIERAEVAARAQLLVSQAEEAAATDPDDQEHLEERVYSICRSIDSIRHSASIVAGRIVRLDYSDLDSPDPDLTSPADPATTTDEGDHAVTKTYEVSCRNAAGAESAVRTESLLHALDLFRDATAPQGGLADYVALGIVRPDDAWNEEAVEALAASSRGELRRWARWDEEGCGAVWSLGA